MNNFLNTIRVHGLYALHNICAHPVSEICFLVGSTLKFLGTYIIKFGDWLHDNLIPREAHDENSENRRG